MAKKRHRHTELWSGRALILIGSICILAVIVSLGIAGKFTTVWLSRSSEGAVQPVNSAVARTGTIVLQTDEDRCESMKFDNDSGRTLEGFKPCDNTVIVDAHGVPLPMGTIHRLDAISKSFRKD